MTNIPEAMQRLYEEQEELTARNEEIAEKLSVNLVTMERLIDGMKSIADSMVQISQNLAEAQKRRVLELEAEKKTDYRDEERNFKTRAPSTTKNENRCHRCNEIGHWAKECPLVPLNKWFCYYCQAIKKHKGDDCFMANKNKRKRY